MDRPTFSEHWYRVAPARPRLRASVRVHRQSYRGEVWRLLEDPSTGRFVRLNAPAWAFVGLLDGSRDVADAWRACCDAHGDDAPTQGEVVEMLGQLHASNLLRADLPGDAVALFERRRQRVSRERLGRAASFLFVRIPLFDPDRLLDRWAPVLGPLFGVWGLALWLGLVGVALVSLAGRATDLAGQASGVLEPGNLWLLYLVFVATKAAHELGHGVACKWFGRRSGDGGEVHTVGIMLLVFAPVPYVDATSAWALRSKWQRATVGAAGMLVEIAIASVAAIVWSAVGDGLVRALAFNTMIVAGVTTLLFNANPLLRYDGYYILCDLTESPNLQPRARSQLHHVVKRWLWGLRTSRPAAGPLSERAWLVAYGLAASAYRLALAAFIVWFVSGRWFFVGALLAIGAIGFLVVAPLVKFARFVLRSPEIERVRARALATSAAGLALLAVGVGAVPAPDRVVARGVVEAARSAGVFVETAGTVLEVTPSGVGVRGGDALVSADDPWLRAEVRGAAAALRAAEGRYRLALATDPGEAAIRAEVVGALRRQLETLEARLEGLVVRAPFDGVWIAGPEDVRPGQRLRRGDRLGRVVTAGDVRIRAVLGPGAGPEVAANAGRARVEVRPVGRPGERWTGAMAPATVLEAGAGGPGAAPGVVVRVSDLVGPRGGADLRVGERAMARFSLGSRPLGEQAVRAVRRLLQRRLGGADEPGSPAGRVSAGEGGANLRPWSG